MLVVQARLAPTAAGAEQAQVVCGILAAVPEPASHEDGALAQHVAVIRGVLPRERLLDLLDQLRGEPLVGVEAERPWRGDRQLVECPVALQGVVLERVLDHVATGAACDLHRPIGAAGIDHEDLGIQAAQTAQREREVALLVERQNDDRKLRGAHEEAQWVRTQGGGAPPPSTQR